MGGGGTGECGGLARASRSGSDHGSDRDGLATLGFFGGSGRPDRAAKLVLGVT